MFGLLSIVGMALEHVAEAVAAGYGAFWTALNAYNAYPLARSYVSSHFEEGGEPEEDADPVWRDVDVFIPAYDEADVIEYPLRSMEAADYPEDRLSTYVVVEEDDTAMQEGLSLLEEEHNFDTIRVPEDYPGEPNKPRALNYAFEQTDGEVIGVFDAEDVVAEEVFREAVTELEEADYAQGRLDMANEEDGWLNTMFRGEYGHWFNRQLPAFHAAGYPVPLGGTTCFFDRETLQEASDTRRERYRDVFGPDDRMDLSELGLDGDAPWDPHNVTEDFELGMLLWAEGYDMAYLDSVTREESPRSVGAWLRQRTRWQRGKTQTLKAFMDAPPEGYRERAHIYAQSALAHLGPVNAVGIAATASMYAANIELPWAVDAMLGLGAASVVGYAALQTTGYHGVTELEQEDPDWRTRSGANAWTLPLYWGLQWMADARAAKQFYLGDTEWEKTDHHGGHMEEDV